MNISRNTAISGIFLLLMLLFFSAFTVTEGEKALLLRLGKIVMEGTGNAEKPVILGPGLHFRIPILNQVRKFDTRLQTLDIQSSRIVTAEKKDVIVDYYVKWKISNLALYFTRTSGNSQLAEELLEQQLNDSLRAEFGRRLIREVISDDRASIMEALNKQTNINAQNLGLDVIDVRIKRIDLPVEVSAAVYDRMRAERERVASEHRAQGKANSEGIRANADANAAITIAIARSEAARIRAEGDAQAAKTYTDAYGKDPSFYAFYRSIVAYRQIFDGKKNDFFILRPDSQFFKYFNQTGVQEKKGNNQNQ